MKNSLEVRMNPFTPSFNLPLHCASIAGHVEAAEFLLTCSVYVKYALSKEKQTAFALAVEKGHVTSKDLNEQKLFTGSIYASVFSVVSI